MATKYKVLTAVGPFGTGDFPIGKAMSKVSNVAAYYRMVATNGSEAEEIAAIDKLDDAAIMTAVKSIDGDDQSAEDDRVLAIFKAAGVDEDEPDVAGEPAERDVTEVSAAQAAESAAAVASQAKSAAEFIDKAAAAPEVSTVLHRIVEANKVVKMMGILTLDVLRRNYTLAELDAAPMPGTKPDDVKGTNYAPEFTRKFTPKKDGGYREGWASWFVTAAERIPEGKSLADQEATLSKKLDQAKNVRDYGDKKDAGGSFNKVVAALRQAIHLHHQLRACANVPHLEASWRVKLAADGKTMQPYLSQYPIEIMDTRDKTGATAVPLTTFLGYKPSAVAKMDNETIAKKGGLIAALMASGGTGSEADGQNQKSRIKNRKDAEGAFAELAAWTAKKESTEALTKWLNEKPEDSDGLLASVRDLYLELKPIYDAYHPRIVAMQDREAAANAARSAAAAKIAADHNAKLVTQEATKAA